VKTFRCGDVVPGCTGVFTGTQEQIDEAVGAHAQDVHGMTEIGPDLLSAVHAHTHRSA